MSCATLNALRLLAENERDLYCSVFVRNGVVDDVTAFEMIWKNVRGNGPRRAALVAGYNSVTRKCVENDNNYDVSRREQIRFRVLHDVQNTTATLSQQFKMIAEMCFW